MRNKKTGLIIKAALIGLFIAVMFLMPVEEPFRKWLRFVMLTVFVVSFIIDLIAYRKKND